MTVKKRLIPKLLIQTRRMGAVDMPVLVTTRRFGEPHLVGDAVSQAKIYESQIADELVVLAIDRHPIAQEPELLELLRRLATEVFMPLTIGGGVTGAEDFAVLLDNGADKVAVNTIALDDPALITRAAERFGAQCVVVSIDFRIDGDGRAIVFADRGTRSADRTALDWARQAVDLGAGELLLTDIDRDGTGDGLNWQVCRAIADAVDVPVLISGGCGLARHFVEGFVDGGAEGVAAGTFFTFRDQSPMQARAHIKNAGVPIRMLT